MTREQGVLAVLAAVFAAALLRWLPSEAPDGPLGVGQPWQTVSMDAELADLADEPGALRARLRAGPGATEATVRRWTRLVDRAEGLVSEHGATRDANGEPPRVQLRGFPRNDHWILAYQLYPLRVTGDWYEQGGRKDDPVDETTVDQFTNRYVDVSELSEAERAQLLEAQQRRADRKRERGR